MQLRSRTHGSIARVPTIIGYQWAENLATGESTSPNPLSADAGPAGGLSTCWDVNHGARDEYRVGGPLFILHQTQEKTVVPVATMMSRKQTSAFGSNPSIVPKPGDDWRLRYAGGCVGSSIPQELGAEMILAPDDYSGYCNPDDLSNLGTHAWERLRPKVEKADILQSLAEARSAPKMLRTTSKGFHELWKSVGGKDPIGRYASLKDAAKDLTVWRQYPKKAGDQFLNAAFGWAPFVRDVHSMCDIAVNFDDYVQQAEKSNGAFKQRRFFEDEIADWTELSNTTVSNAPCAPSMLSYPNYLTGPAQKIIYREKYTRVWYEGSFSVYRPEFDRSLQDRAPYLRKVRQGMTLAGLNPNPTTLYKLVPWTWLADWFVNVSGNVQRLQDAAYGTVVARYMYLMRQTKYRFHLRTIFSTYDGGTHDLSWSKGLEIKRRVPSDGFFGFSTGNTGFSPFQYSILAALGLSKFA